MRGWSITSPAKPVLVRAPRELDALSAPAFRDELAMLLSHGARSLVIEMEGVTFVDSSGMGALVGARKLTEEKGGTLALRGVAPNVAASLRIAGLIGYLGVLEEPAH